MPERTPGTGMLAAAAAALGICCGLPVLGTLGALGFLAGLSTTSWVLVVLGAVVAVIGGWSFFGGSRRAVVESSVRQPGSHQRVAGVSEQSTVPKEH